MDEKILARYCLCTDILKAIGHGEDPPHKMSDAEVMTTGLVAMLFCRGNFEAARALLSAPQYIPHLLSRSRVNRRRHGLKEFFLTCFELLGQTWKPLNTEAVSIMDSWPIAACDNYRIPRAKLSQHEAYRGYIASQKRYFYGRKLHLMVTKDGQPVECFLTPGSYSDVCTLKICWVDVPAGRCIDADKAYNNSVPEDVLMEAAHIQGCPIRKQNSHRPIPPYIAYVHQDSRTMIETVGRLLERMLPKPIHAVTAEGFELKVFLFVLAYSITCL
jgi:hypothetical protein